MLFQLSQLLTHILQMPVYSIALLVAAGTLAGYALTSSLRRDEPTIEQGLKDLHSQNLELQETLRSQRDAYARLERRHVEQHDEWTRLRGVHDRVEQALQSHHLEQASLEEGLSTLTEIRQRALRDLESERQQRREAEEALEVATRREQRLREEVTELQQNHTVVKLHREELMAASTSSDQTLHELARIRQEHEALLQALHMAARQIEGDSTPISWSTAAAATLLTRLAGQLQNTHATTDRLRQDRQEAIIRMDNERLQREALEKLIREHESAGLIPLPTSTEVAMLREALGETHAELDDTRQQLESFAQERDNMLLTMEQSQQLIHALQLDLDSHRRALETIERQRDEGRQQLAKLSEVAATATQPETTRDLSERLQELRLEHGTSQQQITELHQQIAENHQRLRHAELEVDRVRTQRDEILSDLRAEQEERKAQSHALDQQVVKFRRVSEELRAIRDSQEELVRLREQVIELQAQIQVRGTFEESPRTSAESTTIPTYRHDLEHTVAELRQQLREAQLAARDTYERRGNDVKASISPVTQSLRSALSTAPLFEAKLTRGRDHAPAGILARLRHQSGALEAGGSDIETVSRAGESQPLAANGQWHLDPCLGLIYSQAPASSDDLTQIYGINAAVARRLHELGIYTFRQIMEWTPTQVEEFSRLLALGNRIHQEDWTGQARKLGRSNSSPQAA